MKFIVDAQLPKLLARFLSERGFDAIHTLDLPRKNVTDDLEINRISLTENRVVISKDEDFYDSYAARNEPFKLLYLTTGNISNQDLLNLFEKNLLLIINTLQSASVVEINRNNIIVIF
jgi:predicted nuclease of predicted toxin-antitoxin system